MYRCYFPLASPMTLNVPTRSHKYHNFYKPFHELSIPLPSQIPLNRLNNPVHQCYHSSNRVSTRPGCLTALGRRFRPDLLRLSIIGSSLSDIIIIGREKERDFIAPPKYPRPNKLSLVPDSRGRRLLASLTRFITSNKCVNERLMSK